MIIEINGREMNLVGLAFSAAVFVTGLAGLAAAQWGVPAWGALPFMFLVAWCGPLAWVSWRALQVIHAQTAAEIAEWEHRQAEAEARPIGPVIIEAEAVPDEPAVEDVTREDRWRLAVTRFCFNGNQLGFAIRKMVGAGVVSDPNWRTVTELLSGAGVLVLEGGTRWASGWNYPRLRAELRAGVLVLDYPAGEPPEVR